MFCGDEAVGGNNGATKASPGALILPAAIREGRVAGALVLKLGSPVK
jgi:hypothetical protein